MIAKRPIIRRKESRKRYKEFERKKTAKK